MADDHDLTFIEDLLRSRSVVAGEKSQEGVRDSGIHSHHAGQLLGSSAGLLSIAMECGHWVVPSTHCFWIPPRQEHAVRSYGPLERLFG